MPSASVTSLVLLVLALTAWPAHGQLLDDDGFQLAAPGRPWQLPRDHGSHPETRTEWWYVTGSLRDDDGNAFGFQATWFRRALQRQTPAQASPLAVRDVLVFHGALSDVATGQLSLTEEASRAFAPWASASEHGLDVNVFEHRLWALDEGAQLSFSAGDARLQLQLDLMASPLLLHGEEPGLSRKGSEPGQASWYATHPVIPVSGEIVNADGSGRSVQGRAWLDHEFGAGPLGHDQVGWDWFSPVLDDGTVLMAYMLRRADGSLDPASSGTLLLPGETPRPLARDDFSITVTDHWLSPDTAIRYPAGWTLEVPSAGLLLEIAPAFPAQELVTRWTGVTYWEGLCAVTGWREGAPVSGDGYVELVGYGASIADRFAPSNR